MQKKNAFTLIEILVVLAIMSLLLGLSVAGFQSLGKQQEVDQDAQDILTSINQARNYAIDASSDGIADSWVYGYVYHFYPSGNQYIYCISKWIDPGDDPTTSGFSFPGTLTQLAPANSLTIPGALATACADAPDFIQEQSDYYNIKGYTTLTFNTNGVCATNQVCYLAFENITGNIVLFNQNGKYSAPPGGGITLTVTNTQTNQTKNIIISDTNGDPPHLQ